MRTPAAQALTALADAAWPSRVTHRRLARLQAAYAEIRDDQKPVEDEVLALLKVERARAVDDLEESIERAKDAERVVGICRHRVAEYDRLILRMELGQ